MLSLTRVPLESVDWHSLQSMGDHVPFQTRAWLRYLAATQAAEPVVAHVHERGAQVGWFTGLVTTRWGVRALGSPLPGWGTPYLGFNLSPGVSRRQAVQALVPFAFEDLRCAHLELCDRWLSHEDFEHAGARTEPQTTFLVDLRAATTDIQARLTSGTRQNLRKAARVGLVVEDAAPAGFAADYYAQLRDVFAKQGLVPPYGQERVQALIEHLHPTGQLQLIRVRTSEGQSIATALVLGLGATAYFWGGASWRQHQHLRPNETLFWHAFCTWKARGAEVFDFGGGGDYKRKYGGQELVVPHGRWSRWRVLEPLRDTARRAVRVKQRVRGALPEHAQR